MAGSTAFVEESRGEHLDAKALRRELCLYGEDFGDRQIVAHFASFS